MGSSGEIPTEQIIPSVNSGETANFIGGTLAIEKEQYIIRDVSQTGTNPDFAVYKKDMFEAELERDWYE